MTAKEEKIIYSIIGIHPVFTLVKSGFKTIKEAENYININLDSYHGDPKNVVILRTYETK